MARLKDMPTIFRTVGWYGFAKRVYEQVLDDNLIAWASALAYSWLFAIFPFLIFLLTLVPYLPEVAKSQAHKEVREMVFRAVPNPEAAQTLWTNIENNLNLDDLLHRKDDKVLPRLLGLALALWAASGGMNMTMTALDRCYEIAQGRPIYQKRPLAMAMTLVVAVLMILVLSLLPVGTLLKHWVIRHGYLPRHSPILIIFDIVRWTLSVSFMITVVAVIYYKGPSIRHRFVWLTPGGVFSIIVWIVLGLAFRLYVEKWGHFNQTYGTVGGVVILLLFFYIDGLVLLIGAEINSEVDFEILKIKRGTRDFSRAESTSSAGAPTAI